MYFIYKLRRNLYIFRNFEKLFLLLIYIYTFLKKRFRANIYTYLIYKDIAYRLSLERNYLCTYFKIINLKLLL